MQLTIKKDILDIMDHARIEAIARRV
uniref:Uncharacterized protein n=1 Tax=Arundo donax TaxID=35708 RepID=A0A0A8Z0H3_ARUDO